MEFNPHIDSLNQTGETGMIKKIFFVILALVVIGAIVPDTSKGNSANTTHLRKVTTMPILMKMLRLLKGKSRRKYQGILQFIQRTIWRTK